MKLLAIITSKENTKKLKAELVSSSFGLTKLQSEGGFLEKKNTTFLVGVEDDKVDDVLEIVKGCCKTKKKTITAPALMSTGMESGFNPEGTTKIKVGGATVFVVRVDRFERF